MKEKKTTADIICDPDTLHALAVDILIAHKTRSENAYSVSDALIAAECDGKKGHGLMRLPHYARHAYIGKINGLAIPEIIDNKKNFILIDAHCGFAFPACQLAIETLIHKCKEYGIAAVGINRSHHFGQAGYHVEKIANAGLIGLIVGNSPAAIAPWGGYKPIFGTNPIAFAAPRLAHSPLVIDMSVSKVARGNILYAAQNKQMIPNDWALDINGRATIDPEEALKGSLLPAADAKGANLALMIEILSAALTGAFFGYESSSFFSEEGTPPQTGQLLLAIDPHCFGKTHFLQRIEELIHQIEQQENTRLPGSKAYAQREQSKKNGITLSRVLYEKLMNMLHPDK